ncbi:MAG: 3'-5' exonuclease [Schwartzia sp.]|nr:3'-5' exonuclease [Schwartzia sp. (in: firmicutes)]
MVSMGELRGRTAAGQLSEPALVFAGRALFPLPKQLFRLYDHAAKYLVPSEDFLARDSGSPARLVSETRTYITEFGPLTASTMALAVGRAMLPRGGEALFLALARKSAPEDWAHAIVFRMTEKLRAVYGHLKSFLRANGKRFEPVSLLPHPVSADEALRVYRRCFPAVIFDLEMNYERPIQFAGTRLTLAADGTVERETLSLYVRQKPKLSRYVAELTHLTDTFLRQNGIPEPQAAERIRAFLGRDGCFAGNALHNDFLSLRGMFERCHIPLSLLRRDVVDLTAAVRFDQGGGNEPSLQRCMEFAGLSFTEERFHDAAYDTEGSTKLFLHYVPQFIMKYGNAPLAPWYFFEPVREKESLDYAYAGLYRRRRKTEEVSARDGSGAGGRTHSVEVLDE